MSAHRDALRILLVEDDPAHAELVLRAFEGRAGAACRVVHVSDGKAALDYLFRRGEYTEGATSPRPDLILLDLRLPKIDGLEVLGRVKADAQLRVIPVVMLTTSAAEQDVVRAYTEHVNSYLVKPVDFDQSERLMQELGFYWLTRNMSPACDSPFACLS